MTFKRKLSTLVLGISIFTIGTFAKTMDTGAWGSGSTGTSSPNGKLYFPNASNGDYSYGYFKDNESVTITGTTYAYNNKYVFKKFKELSSGFWYSYFSPLSQDATISLNGIPSSRYISQLGDMIENRYDTNYSLESATKNTVYTTSGNGRNFKKYGTAVNDMSSANPKTGTITNASYGNELNPHFAGKTGEWRYIGYSSNGLALSNPLFPADYFLSTSIVDYGWEDYPWLKGMVAAPNDSPYDDRYDSNGVLLTRVGDRDTKLLAINKLIEYYPALTSKGNSEYWRKKLSLRSNPYIDSPNFVGTYYSNGLGARFYREVVAPAIVEAPSDLELKSLSIVEVETNKVVASINRGGNAQIFDRVVPGYAYKVISTIKNVGTVKTKLPQSMTKIGYAIDENATNNTESNGFSKNNENFIASKSTQLNPNEETTVEYIVKVPTSYSTSKQVTTYETKSTNNFSATYSYTDNDGYSGTLSKDGQSYAIGGSETTADTIEVTDSVTSNTNSFPSTLYYSKYGYTGTLRKEGNPEYEAVEGTYIPPESKTATSTSTETNSNATYTFPATKAYNSDGFIGTLSKVGEPTRTVKSGSENGVIDSKTQTHTIESTTNSFPNTYSYNSGGYSGTLSKNGAVRTTTAPKTQTKSINKTYTASNSSDLGNTKSYTESGVTTTLTQAGAITSRVVSGSENGVIDSKTATYTASSTTNSFASTYAYNSGGYSGTLSKSGAVRTVVTPGANTNKPITKTYTSSKSSDLGNTKSYTESGVTTTLTATGAVTSRVVSGSAPISKTIYYTLTVEEFSKYGYNAPNTYFYNKDGYSGTIKFEGFEHASALPYYYGTVSTSDTRVYEYSRTYSGTLVIPGPSTTTYYQDYSGTANKYGDTRVYEYSRPYSGTITIPMTTTRTINKTFRENNQSNLGETRSYTDPDTGITLTLTQSSTIRQIVTGGSENGIIDSRTATYTLTSTINSFPETYFYGKNGYTGYLSKSGNVRSIKKEETQIKEDSAYRDGYNESDVPSTIVMYSSVFGRNVTFNASSPIFESEYGGYIIYYRYYSYKEDIPTGNFYYIYEQDYSGTANKYGDTRTYAYERDYTGTLVIPEVDTKYCQDYSGTVYKYGDTRVWEHTQNYSGTVTKPAIDNRTFKYIQTYIGNVTRPAGGDNREYRQNYTGTVYKTATNSVDSAFMFTSTIHDLHKAYGDNKESNNDSLSLTLGVNTGNVKQNSVQVIDINGNVTNNIIPGDKYKIRYNYSYAGPELKEWKTVKTNYNYTCGTNTNRTTCSAFNDTGSYSRPEVLGKIKTNITRYHSGTASQTQQFVYQDVDAWKTVANGTNFKFESPYMVLEVPYLTTEVVFDPSVSKQRNTSMGYNKDGIYGHLNNSTTDDKGSKNIADTYDIKVTNVRVVSKSEKPLDMENTTTKINALLKYDIEMIVPSYVTNYSKDVSINAVVGSTNVSDFKHIKAGMNRNLTTPVEMIVPVGSTMRIDGAVGVNLDGYVWEYNNGADMSTNNSGNTIGTNNHLTISPPYNPSVIKSKIFQSANTWDETYRKLATEGTKISYDLFYRDDSLNGTTKSFYNFKNKSDTTQTLTNNESVHIEKVLFRSKLTTDLNKGVNKDGWIDLTTEDGLIKAGYGYEMQIYVRYSSDVFDKQPVKQATDGSTVGSRTEVSPLNAKYNFYKDIYLDTGGAEIYSGSGIYNTRKAFNCEVISETNSSIYVRYTIASSNTFGMKTASKIFVGSETKDGLYDLKIFTPAITGNPNESKPEMVASRTVKLRVKGSMLDDVNTHLTQ